MNRQVPEYFESEEQRKSRAHDDQFELATVYSQGGEALRNYSNLTMRVRTLAQHMMIVYTGGAAVAVAKVDAARLPWFGLFGGIVLVGFAMSLALVDWHYQSAFSAIRDSMQRLERIYGTQLQDTWRRIATTMRDPEIGLPVTPWCAHRRIRTHGNDHVASYVPFALLAAFGAVSMIAGGFALNAFIGAGLTLALVLGVLKAWWSRSFVVRLLQWECGAMLRYMHSGEIPRDIQGARSATTPAPPVWKRRLAMASIATALFVLAWFLRSSIGRGPISQQTAGGSMIGFADD